MAAASSSDRVARAPFHVMVKPAGPICNLDCAYCFYLDKRELFPAEQRFEMPEPVLELFTRRYIEAQPPGTEEVNFAWQGGEPTLLGRAFFERAVALQKRHARAGMRISNALQTNGLLLDEDWCRFLRDEGFLVGISVDGPEAVHDAYRLDQGGRGSFARVMRGVELLRRFDVPFNTLGAVHRKSGDHPVELYELSKEIGSSFLQLIPIVERAEAGGVTERSVRPEQFGDFLVGLFDRWADGDVGEVHVQLFEQTLSAVAGAGAPLCVHAETCGRALALEHDGTLFSCDHFVDREHRLGSLLEEDLAELVDRPVQQRFGDDKRDGLCRACRECDVLELCWGGCPKDRLVAGERPYLCAGYLRFFRHSLESFRSMLRCMRMGLPAARFRELENAERAGRPIVEAAARRNDPCPCGSGLKYKRCCLQTRS